MSIRFTPQAIPEVILVEPQVFGDSRGFFMESYRASLYQANGIPAEFSQDNLARSAKNVLRGLHYQIHPTPSAKLVQAVEGEVLDVAVDLRIGSPSFGQHVRAILSAENRHQLYIPEGFAHGYLVLSETALVSYKVSSEYTPDLERGLRWDDPALGIDWGVNEPLLSEKDQDQPGLKDAEITFTYT